MRILLVTIEPPLPFGNAAARWYYVLLRGLVDRGHEVTALAACSKPQEIPQAMALFPKPSYDLRCFPMRERAGVAGKLESFLRPMSYLFAPEIRRELSREIARGYDVLHLEQLWSAWLAPRDSARTVVNVHYLFDIDARGQKCSSVKARILQGRILRTERALLGRVTNICALSSRLTDRIGEINPAAKRFTVPLGIDAALYPFEPMPQRAQPTVGLIGSFNWRPTLIAAKRLINELWPHIKQRVPRSRLMMVGRRAKEMLGPSTPEDVTIHSDVADTLPYFRELDVLLYAPPVGSGMKVKVLEAFAMGTPVVTNNEGVEGIPARDGEHAGVASTNSELVNRAVDLLNDPALRDRYRSNARALLVEHCSEAATLARVERMYESVAGQCSAKGPAKDL